MFNCNFRHPLDNLIHDNRLFMMEAIIPFVSDNMKAPLAMYIKIMELMAILSALKDSEYTKSCGLHRDINNQDDILSSLADCGFADIKGQFDNMKKAMQMMNVMNDSGKTSNTDDLYTRYNPSKDDSMQSTDLYGSIKDLFDTYDQQQGQM